MNNIEKYYVDIVELANVPDELLQYIPPQVYEDENFERHASIARMAIDLKYGPSIENSKFLYERMKLLLTIAYENYSTYRDYYNSVGFSPEDFQSLDDLKRVPIITKTQLRMLYDEIKQNPFVKIHHESSTSGTSDTQLKLVNDIDSHNRSLLHIFEMYRYMTGEELKPNDWIYSIYDEPQLLTSILGRNKIFTIGVDAPLEIVAKHIRKLKPKIVSGYASKILELARLLPDAKQIGIQLFTTNSEYSSPFSRHYISSQIGVPILDEYSSEELLIMGWEIDNGKYLAPQNVSYMEFLEQKGKEVKSVVGTNLWDLTMPRIRYFQGDHVEKAYIENGQTYFENLIGKENGLYIQGNYYTPREVSNCIDTIVLPEGKIIRYQVVQVNREHLQIEYQCKKGVSIKEKREYELRISQALYDLLGEIDIAFLENKDCWGSKEKRYLIKSFYKEREE